MYFISRAVNEELKVWALFLKFTYLKAENWKHSNSFLIFNALSFANTELNEKNKQNGSVELAYIIITERLHPKQPMFTHV